ncbi:MAG: hypothetical protein K2R98_30145 [Gemmataceae bacterium]|nr:hypothetical protein [Gemmataceae bacterium]
MRTEEFHRGERLRDTRGASLALQDLMPPAWEVTDPKGKPVRLSSAGYVLFFGRRYELRILMDSDVEPAPDVHLISAPPFFKRQAGLATVVRHGQTYRCLPFKVQSAYGWLRRLFKAPYEILCGDLEVESGAGEIPGRGRIFFSCPVVARMPWSIGLVLLLIVGYLGGWLVGQLGNMLRDCWTRGTWPWSGSEDWWSALPTNPNFWLWPVIIAALNPLACLLTHFYHLWQRSRELESSYRERYPSLSGGP